MHSKEIPQEWFSSPFEVVDWGCGQAMGTINLLDHLKNAGYQESLKRVVLIEPSAEASSEGKFTCNHIG